MLKIVWILNDPKQEVKVYEMLAAQYFYKQDIERCKKYQDRAFRGKIEADHSSVKQMSLFQGFRSSDDANQNKKRVFHSSCKESSKLVKLKDSTVKDYKAIFKLIADAKSGKDTKVSLSSMVTQLI